MVLLPTGGWGWGGFSHFQTHMPHEKVRCANHPVGHCLLSPQPVCGSGSWLLFKRFLEVGAKERRLSSLPASSSIAGTVNVVSGSAHHQPGSSHSVTG